MSCFNGFQPGKCPKPTPQHDPLSKRYPTGVSRPKSPPLKIIRDNFRNRNGWMRWNTLKREYKCPVKDANGNILYYERKWANSHNKCIGFNCSGVNNNPSC